MKDISLKSISNIKLQTLIGGLLGDSSLTVRGVNGACRLKMGHTEDHLDYLLWKKEILQDLFLQHKPNSYNGKSTWSSKVFYSFQSIQTHLLKETLPLFYRTINGKKKRKITWKTLKYLDEFGLLIWYLDDGCLVKDKRELIKGKTINIYSDAYSLSEQKIIKRFLWKRFRLEAKIQFDKTHNIYYIRFNRKESLRIFSIFQGFYASLPKSMLYKIDK